MVPLQKKQKKVSAEKAADANAAMDSLARLVATRERSVREVETRLADKGYTEQTIAQAVERALACDLLDDTRFAEGYIKDKLRAGWGRKRIEQELYRFGIQAPELKGYPEAYFSEDEQLQTALQALERHHSRSKNLREARYRYLVSKGYSSDIVSQAVRLYSEREES